MFNEGDKVYITAALRPPRKAVISRVTKTQAVVKHERYEERFNRETGRSIGGGPWDTSRIEHPSSRLDAEWAAERTRQAAFALSDAARESDPDAIRDAYARWESLMTKEQSA